MSHSDNENTENEDPFAIISETTDEDEFVKVMESEDGESFIELPKEVDGTIILPTLQGQFPNAAGLKYKSSSGGWRGVRITNGVLKAPQVGWGDNAYYVTFKKSDSTAKKEEENENHDDTSTEGKDAEEKSLLQDLFVIHLPAAATDEDLMEYFTKTCGDMTVAQVIIDRNTGRSRGFGFIRFKDIDAAKEALTGEHELLGKKLEVMISRKKKTPCQLFVGRLPDGSTQKDLEEYFGKYGELTEAHVTIPFRGFGFVTYAFLDDAESVLRSDHEIKGSRVNVALADPKEENGPRGRRNGRRADDYGGGDSRRRGYTDIPRDRSRHDRRDGNMDGPREWSGHNRRDGNMNGPMDRSGHDRRDSNMDGPRDVSIYDRKDDRRPRRGDSPPRSDRLVHEFKDMLYNLLEQGRR